MVRLREAVLQVHVRQGPAGGKDHSEHTDPVRELQGEGLSEAEVKRKKRE